MEKENNNNNNNNIGALWIKESQKGDFFKGFITLDNGEKVNIVIFKNNYKNSEKQPDFQILKAKNFNQEEKVKDEQIDLPNDLPF